MILNKWQKKKEKEEKGVCDVELNSQTTRYALFVKKYTYRGNNRKIKHSCATYLFAMIYIFVFEIVQENACEIIRVNKRSSGSINFERGDNIVAMHA